MTVPLLNDAFDTVMCQPKGDDPRISLYLKQSISAAFMRGCIGSRIVDLHFHDLRHHALSILFEQGYAIQEVAIVSGHSSWDMLKRYTHIKPESLHRWNDVGSQFTQTDHLLQCLRPETGFCRQPLDMFSTKIHQVP